ncbi:uncharacterized protein LOC129322518 [Prosopis cineraria]|uniref:uncharacterized protein LOC129322518 n=1 Tax=Prosopis cineraria TaxID=364024 RepID=UPI00241073C2|nr:uncharacterized protein LOC129322518 [Prosopis cineraria]
MKLDTRHGWNYDGCTKCAIKTIEQNDSTYCPTCKKKPDSVEPKLKIHYTVEDETGKVTVVFWDKLAVQLLHKTVAELKAILHDDKRTYDFPDELDNLIGKKMILKLKINAYNKKYSNSSISVTQYTECGDLINEFTEANDEGQVEDNSKEVSNQHMDKPQNDEPVEKHQLSVQQVPQNYVGLEEITITELVKTQLEPAVAQTKGKRKCAAKK